METDEFTLDVEGVAPGANAEAASTSSSNNKYLASGQAQVSGGVGLDPSIRPHAPRLIAEDPEKRRIVGRQARPLQSNGNPAANLHQETQHQEPSVQAPEPPAAPVFEGSGLAEVGTLRKARQQQDDEEEDDEFSYALEGGKREEGFHKQVFRHRAMPAHLVSNVKQQLNKEVLQEEDEEDEDEEDECGVAGEDGGEEGEDAAGEQEEEDEDKHAQSRSREQDKQAACSWTTFAVSEGPGESLADESDTARPPAEAPAAPSPQPRHDALAEELPSYKLMQVLHVTGPNSATAVVGPSGRTCAGVTAGASGDDARRAGDGAEFGGGFPSKERSSFRGFNSPATAPPMAAAVAASPPILPSNSSIAFPAAGTSTAEGLGLPTAEPTPLTAGNHVAAPRPRQEGAAAAAGTASPEEEDEWEAANRERQREQAAARVRHSAGGGGAALAGASAIGAATTSAGATAAQLSYHQALLHFLAMDTSALRPGVVAALPPPPGLLARLLCLGPPALRPPLLREQMLQLLALARLPFNDDDGMHVRLLGALYGAFTGKNPEPPRFGSHWAELGFQGQDPATDLRGCGMLGLLQLYYLTQWSADAASKMLRLSQHPVQEFPLAIVSLNVTKWTLQALRAGQLHGAANSRGSTVEAAQQFYAGAMATFYTTWLRGGKTMAASGHVLRELEARALRRPGLMLDAAQRVDLPDPPPAKV